MTGATPQQKANSKKRRESKEKSLNSQLLHYRHCEERSDVAISSSSPSLRGT